MARVRVHAVNIPEGSFLGYGTGIDTETGEYVTFTGDRRPLSGMLRALAGGSDLVVADVPEAMLRRSQLASRDEG